MSLLRLLFVFPSEKTIACCETKTTLNSRRFRFRLIFQPKRCLFFEIATLSKKNMIEKILYFFRVRKEKSTNKKLFYSVKKKYKYFFERKLLNIRKIFNPFYFWFWRWLFSFKKLASKIVMQNWKRIILAK